MVDAGPVMMHPNQLTVKIGTVRTLVAEQFPSWAELSVRAVASHGTVNALFRIGDRLVARFPLQPGDVAETLRWLKWVVPEVRRGLSCGFW
jgi:aminoglycoside phosphotransferase (APT) family kinase protein